MEKKKFTENGWPIPSVNDDCKTYGVICDPDSNKGRLIPQTAWGKGVPKEEGDAANDR